MSITMEHTPVEQVVPNGRWDYLSNTVGVTFPEGHKELDRSTLETVALAMMEVRERSFYACWCERLAEDTAKELYRQNFAHPKLLAYLHGAYLAMEQGVI
jgi:hypothetical protein